MTNIAILTASLDQARARITELEKALKESREFVVNADSIRTEQRLRQFVGMFSGPILQAIDAALAGKGEKA